jgi:hypothetical protein
MKRYYAAKLWTEDMGYVPENPTEPYGRYAVVLTDEAEAEIARLRELVARLRELLAGQDDGGHWYSQASMDAVVRERDKYREVLEVVAKGAYTLSIMQSMARDAVGDA